jgi:Tol biopolymer transport system component
MAFGSAYDTDPVWSPDGSSIIFSSNRDGPYDLYQKPVSGAEGELALVKSGADKHATSWSRDGRFLLCTGGSEAKSNIWVFALVGDKKPVPFLSPGFNEREARFSPDGRWVAYTSDESGRRAVWVRSFSMNSAKSLTEAGGKWQVSSGYGHQPRWRSGGKELYYLSLDYDTTGRAMAVRIVTDPAFRAGDTGAARDEHP